MKSGNVENIFHEPRERCVVVLSHEVKIYWVRVGVMEHFVLVCRYQPKEKKLIKWLKVFLGSKIMCALFSNLHCSVQENLPFSAPLPSGEHISKQNMHRTIDPVYIPKS